MKKIFFFILFSLSFILFPYICNAASLELTSDVTNIAPNKNVVITINASDFSAEFGSIHFDLKYDASKFSYSNSKSLQGELTEEKKNGVVSITIDSSTGMNNGKLYQITLTSSNTATSGSSQITIGATNDCFDKNLSMISVAGNILTLNHYLASTIDTLSSLSVSGCDLSPKFNSDTLNYTCLDTTLKEVTVTGSVTDSKAKVIGLGINKLEYGNNNLSIIVISESGSKKKYNINITRKDVRNDNNSLSNLEVVGYNINFEPDNLEYDLTVAPNVEKITINGTALENTSIINGLGEVELKSDYNSFFVTVQAENGGTKVYRINVSKKEDSEANTLLSFLSFNDIPIKLTEKKTYLIGISSNINSLDLKYETSSSGVECEVIGNSNLKEGINIVKIIIKASDAEDTTYTLLVYKESDEITSISDFNEIKEINNNYFFQSKESTNIKIPRSFLELFLNSNNYFKYNIVNEYNGLLVSFKFTKNSIISDNLEVIFSKISSENLSYSSNIPKGVLIKLYLENVSKDVKIYNYDDGAYTLIDTVTPINGYIEFMSNGSENYIFSEETLFNELKKSELTVMKIIIIFIAGIVIGCILHYYFEINRKKKINLEITKI